MSESARPPFWNERTRRMLGKTVLVGITYTTREGKPDGERQFHGVIERADERRGFAVRIDDTTIEWLPPHLAAFAPAAPGDYRLRSTGQSITDPDLLCTWTVRRPADADR